MTSMFEACAETKSLSIYNIIPLSLSFSLYLSLSRSIAAVCFMCPNNPNNPYNPNNPNNPYNPNNPNNLNRWTPSVAKRKRRCGARRRWTSAPWRSSLSLSLFYCVVSISLFLISLSERVLDVSQTRAVCIGRGAPLCQGAAGM